MTELETMQRAKMYIDKLARGIDPISDREIPEDSVLNNVRLSRCFFYVSEVLGKVIANGGAVGERPALREFQITREQLAGVQLSADPITVSQLAERIRAAVYDPQMKKLNVTVITNWLLEKGFLEKQLRPDGTSGRIPTANGIGIGLITQLRQGKNGEYQTILYTLQAQRFVLDHLFDMLA